MKKAVLPLLVLLCAVVLSAEEKKEDHYSRGIVIQALELPNKLGVSGREFTTKENPKGEGVFVYDPRTRFAGVERFLIWVIIEDSAYPLNGPSKTITPTLTWPREANPAVWKKTGLDPYIAKEALDIVFGPQP